MDFKKVLTPKILVGSLIVVVIIVGVMKNFAPSASSFQAPKDNSIPPVLMEKDKVSGPNVNHLRQDSVQDATEGSIISDDAAIQEQLNKDRESQKETKELKTKLEQTDLELQQQKDMVEINKLRMDNAGIFKDPLDPNQKNLPDVSVQYIGGNFTKKEAILSISGTSFQVKEKSTPTDNIQVVSISDTGVTLHFTAPQDLTKTFDYKPE